MEILFPTAKVSLEPPSFSASSMHQPRRFYAELQCTRAAAAAAALPLARLPSQSLWRRLGTSSTAGSSTSTATASSNINKSSVTSESTSAHGDGGSVAEAGSESGGAKGYMKRRGVSGHPSERQHFLWCMALRGIIPSHRCAVRDSLSRTPWSAEITLCSVIVCVTQGDVFLERVP